MTPNILYHNMTHKTSIVRIPIKFVSNSHNQNEDLNKFLR